MSDDNDPRPPDAADAADGGRHRHPDTEVDNEPDLQIAAVKADIERTREQLADTVDQLQAKLDVKARASAGARDVQERAKAQVLDDEGHPRPQALAAAGAIVAGVLAVVLVKAWRRRQTRQRTWGRS